MKIITKFSLPETSSFYDPVVVDLDKKILKVDRELRDLEGDKERQKNEVRSLSSQINLNVELGILQILITNIQNSLPHRFAVIKGVQDLEELLMPYVPMPISSDPNSLPSPVKKPKLNSPPSAKKTNFGGIWEIRANSSAQTGEITEALSVGGITRTEI